MTEGKRSLVEAGGRPRAARSALATMLVVSGVLAATIATAGTVTGTVRLAGAAMEPRKLPVTVDHAVCGKEKDAADLVVSASKGVRHVLVSLATPPADAAWKPPLPTVQMDQQQCVFVPRVVIVPVGGTVEFLNGDRLLHNLRTRNTQNPAFNRTQPKGRTIPIAFTKPEIVRVDCDLHPWMRAWVVVAEHPYHALSGDGGEFTIPGIPPGKYKLQFWHESLATLTRDVTVDAGTLTVNIEMTRK